MSAEDVAAYVAQQLRPVNEQLEQNKAAAKQFRAQSEALANRVIQLEESAQSMRRASEQLQEAMGGLRQQHAALEERMRVVDETHQRYHTTVDEMSAAVARMEEATKDLQEKMKVTSASSGEGRQRRLIETKHMLPAPLGDDYREKWRAWSRKAKKVMGRVDTGAVNRLKPMLEVLEKQPTPLTDEQKASMS